MNSKMQSLPIHFLLRFLIRAAGNPATIPFDFGPDAGYFLDWLPVNQRLQQQQVFTQICTDSVWLYQSQQIFQLHYQTP